MQLDLNAVLDPTTRQLKADARLAGFDTFLLNERLRISSDEAGPGPQDVLTPFLDGARAYRVTVHDTPAVVSYAGILPREMAEGTNLVGPDLVELAVYSAWFPVPVTLANFAWRLKLRLPDDWVIVTNGRPDQGAWVSSAAAQTGDIAFAAAPRSRLRHVGTGITVTELGQPSPLADRIERLTRSALAVLGDAFGPPAPEPLTLAMSYREGFAYSRLPTVFLAGRGSGDDDRDLHTVHHELAHLWWNIAPVSGTQDWLNEALAEYSAVRLTRKLISPQTADAILSEYTALAVTQPGPAIAATGPEDADSFATNKYARGALFFFGLEARLGRGCIDELLARWRDQHTSGDATTESLTAAIAQADPRLADQATVVLTTPAWNGIW